MDKIKLNIFLIISITLIFILLSCTGKENKNNENNEEIQETNTVETITDKNTEETKKESEITSVNHTDEKVDETIGKIPAGKVHYSPDNYYMWDSWCVVKDGTAHLIHLQMSKNDMKYTEEQEKRRGFGHAVSNDLLHWIGQDEILSVKAGSDEIGVRYTGSTIEHEGKYYTFYTIREPRGESIGVAVSEDMYSWMEYSGNPILTPDPNRFIGYDDENTVSQRYVDCRDMLVVKDPNGEGFWGYFVTAADIGLTSPPLVIGVAYSKDLFEWKQMGIAYSPLGLAMHEMVDIFEINGKWYMTLTTTKNNGGLNVFSDPYITRAQIYATADSPEGPFIENPDDNVLIGGQLLSGYSSRTVDFQGKKRILYADTGEGVIALPKNIGINADGNLRAYYSDDLLKSLRINDLNKAISVQPHTSFAWNTKGGVWKHDEEKNIYSCETDQKSWQAFLMKGSAVNLELEFTVTSESVYSSFGIVLSNRGAGEKLSDMDRVMFMDRNLNCVYLTDSGWDMKNCRQYIFEDGEQYHFRMILMGRTVELYINDELIFNSAIQNGNINRAGLFVNDGIISVENLEFYELGRY